MREGCSWPTMKKSGNLFCDARGPTDCSAELVIAPERDEVAAEIVAQREHLSPEAAAQFERALERWPNRSLALLGLARASAALGDRAAARRHYQRLLANWRSADPGLPELAEARTFSPAAEKLREAP